MLPMNGISIKLHFSSQFYYYSIIRLHPILSLISCSQSWDIDPLNSAPHKLPWFLKHFWLLNIPQNETYSTWKKMLILNFRTAHQSKPIFGIQWNDKKTHTHNKHTLKISTNTVFYSIVRYAIYSKPKKVPNLLLFSKIHQSKAIKKTLHNEYRIQTVVYTVYL